MERAEELFENVKSQGRTAVEEFILTRKAEELFLDFKRSADSGAGPRFHEHDRNNLAKAISGFGNSEGGVIVWGVDCSRNFDGSDAAKAEYPLVNVKRFVSWLQGAISGCTVPPHTGVENHAVEIDEKGNGFVATYIPKSDHAPHQEIPSRKYYIRAGSDFVPVPHDVLAGMFGRRPQPKIKINPMIYPLKVEKQAGKIIIPIGFHICNEGNTVAEDLFASILAISWGGPNCSFGFLREDQGFDSYNSISCWSTISKRDVRLPPGGWLRVARIELGLQPPFTDRLEIEATIGCGKAPPSRIVFKNKETAIQNCYDLLFPDLKTPEYDRVRAFEMIKTLLGMPTLQQNG